MVTRGPRCDAEVPVADDVPGCLLPQHHLTRWHEGLTYSPCPECARRDCHTAACSMPEHEVRMHVVRWEGPDAPMPELSLTGRMWLNRVLKGTDRISEYVWSMVAGDGNKDWVAFVDAAQEWGRALGSIEVRP